MKRKTPMARSTGLATSCCRKWKPFWIMFSRSLVGGTNEMLCRLTTLDRMIPHSRRLLFRRSCVDDRLSKWITQICLPGWGLPMLLHRHRNFWSAANRVCWVRWQNGLPIWKLFEWESLDYLQKNVACSRWMSLGFEEKMNRIFHDRMERSFKWQFV